ncbi:hypothetical protein, partial [uncultured Rhizobium sp.]|uniref:hypothetical protein n=1 Tax=uncultured Rhizobium sp. TaxID=155567 RepID=UPI00262ED637
ENKTQSQKAPEGASRCRVLTSGISLYLMGPGRWLGGLCSSQIAGDKQEKAGKVNPRRRKCRNCTGDIAGSMSF